MEIFQSSLDPNDVDGMLEEICVPLHVQNETVKWYNRAIDHALVNKSSIFWERFVFDPKSGIVWGLLASTGNQLCS